MPLNKVAKGSNMYQGWVTHTHSHLGGACPHKCSYCSIAGMAKRFPVMRERYTGPLRLIAKEFDVAYGSGKTIFIDDCGDLWANAVPAAMIEAVLAHCRKWPDNVYVFQTKNPDRYGWFERLGLLPPNVMLGCTIETNREVPYTTSLAPSPFIRATAMWRMPRRIKTFITIEPIMQFDLSKLSDWIVMAAPAFVNIGADSKRHGLPEPSENDIVNLGAVLEEHGIEVRCKDNLKRICKTNK